MKKELKKRKNSNIVDTDLHKISRNVLRKHPVDMIFDKGDGTGIMLEKTQISPAFAAIADSIIDDKKSKAQKLQTILDMTEVWTPDGIDTTEKKPKIK